MNVERHTLWRIVKKNLEGLKQHAPEGYMPVVDVFLAGRSEPIRLNHVATGRDPAFPWTLLEDVADAEDDGDLQHKRLIFAREEHIVRIEIRFAEGSKRHPTGFSYGEDTLTDDPPPRSSDE